MTLSNLRRGKNIMYYMKDRNLDTSKFENIAYEFDAYLHNYALKLTKNVSDAEDLLQDTYLKAFANFKRFEPGTNFKAWIFRIMTNLYIDRYRKVSKDPNMIDYSDVEESRILDYQVGERIEDKYVDVNFNDVLRNDVDDDIKKAIDKLPPQFKEVIIMCDILNYTYEEMAKFIACPLGTVMSRIFRGRQLLKQSLNSYAANRGYTGERMNLSAA